MTLLLRPAPSLMFAYLRELFLTVLVAPPVTLSSSISLIAMFIITEAAGQINTADAAAPNNTADSAEISASLFGNRKEATVKGVPTDDAESLEGTGTQESISETPGSDADIDAAATDAPESDEREVTQGSFTKVPGSDADFDATVSNDPVSHEIGGAQDSVREAGANDADVNVAASEDTVTEDD